MKVAAQDNNDVTSCVGVGINVGSRFESKKEQGMSAILKRLLLTGPVTEKLETIGASLVRSEGKCKDSIYVAGEVLRPHVKVCLDGVYCDLHRLVGLLACFWQAALYSVARFFFAFFFFAL